MVGYDGGRIAAEALADHVVVTRSEHIPRIQEAQAERLHVLRELVEDGRDGAARPRRASEGTVQGVGFRPYVYRLARELGLAGWVRNDERGVVVEVEGAGGGGRAASSRGLPPRRRRWPPSSACAARTLAPTGERGFAIVASARGGRADALVSARHARRATTACAELFDPADRRYRYPFINCTNCGPRFTIVRGVPYDRPRTTMAGFAMCAALPGGVRGPARPPLPRPAQRLPGAAARARGSSTRRARRASAGARRGRRGRRGALRGGAIVAVKGLGGYHLACRADDEARGRRAARAQAPRGPAVRADGRATSPRPARWSSSARTPRRRCSPRRERPIVLAPRRAGARGGRRAWRRASRELGVMLPYTPLHHLLLRRRRRAAGA